MDISEVNNEELIHFVKLCPELWNQSEEVYKNYKYKRHVTWLQIAQEIYDGFDGLSREEQRDIAALIQKRWKCMRDQYWRWAKKGALGINHKYRYADQMSFLAVNQPGQLYRKTINKQIKVKQSAVDDESETSSVMIKKPKWQSSQPTNRIGESMEDRPVVTSTTARKSSDPDMAFFESVLPFVEKFSEQQKLEFRTDVLNSVKRISKSPNY